MRLAHDELAAAVVLIAHDQPEPRLSVVLAALGAEKALKAALASIGVDPPRSHDLVALARRCDAVVTLTSNALDLQRLSDANAHARYPAADETSYDLDEASELVGVARSVITDVTAALGSPG